MMATDLERVTQILAKIEDLPTLPSSVLEVMRIVDDPRCSTSRLGNLVLSDPPLAARVLRLANSAYYGFPRAVAAVPQAITLLGFATLRNVALSTAVFDLFRTKKEPSLDLPALWRHSVATATAARLIARRVRYTPLEKAFTAGLLHDIGKVLIARYLPGSMGRVVETVAAENIMITDAEQRVLGVSHAAFGAWLAARWAFPTSLVDAIAFHHQPPQALDNRSLAAIVCVADALTHRTGIGSGGDELPRPIDPVVLELLAVDEADLHELESALAERREDIESFAGALSR